VGEAGGSAAEPGERPSEGEGHADRPAAADTDSVGTAGRPGSGRPEPAAADGAETIDWGPFTDAIRRWEYILGRPAPLPRQRSLRGGGDQLAPVFVEWMMGLPAGWVTAVPGVSRNDQLKMLGNGVVPQQAMIAIRTLVHIERIVP